MKRTNLLSKRKINKRHWRQGSIALLSTAMIGMSVPTNTSAETLTGEFNNVEISNVETTDYSTNFTMNADDTTIDFNIKKLDSGTVEVNTVTNDNEIHTALYNINDNFINLDGEDIELQKENYYNVGKANITSPSISTNVIVDDGGASSSWSATYQSTNRISIGGTVASIGALATIVGGVIAAGALVGVAITTTSIAATIGNWASVVGLGTLAVGYLLNGYVEYDTYRTTKLVPTGYGSNQYAYRYQNVRAVFSVKGKTFNQMLVSSGAWWFGSKPY